MLVTKRGEGGLTILVLADKGGQGGSGKYGHRLKKGEGGLANAQISEKIPKNYQKYRFLLKS